MSRLIASRLAALFAFCALGLTPLHAQIRAVDPNSAIDADLAPAQQTGTKGGGSASVTGAPPPAEQNVTVGGNAPGDGQATAGSAPPAATDTPAAGQAEAQAGVYQRDDLIGAAEGVFGKGAEGLAGIIEKILKDQGEPNAYIAGREAGGAIGIGLRYGSGTLFHKIEGDRKVYWTGPSLGFDLGGNASKTFVLVYNLYDSQDLFKRYPAGEGAAYLVGGFTASYLRWGSVVLIPIRLGVGYRLGANVGYMKFTDHSTWLPF